MKITENSTLAEARVHLRENFDAGCKCPACGQHVQRYDYKLFASSAFALIRLYRLTEKAKRDNPDHSSVYFHIKEYAEAAEGRPRAPHFAELRFWDLIEAMPSNLTHKKTSGFWKITEKGKDFVRGKITVHSRILVYNNHFECFSDKSEFIDIKTALTNKFDYQELMGL